MGKKSYKERKAARREKKRLEENANAGQLHDYGNGEISFAAGFGSGNNAAQRTLSENAKRAKQQRAGDFTSVAELTLGSNTFH